MDTYTSPHAHRVLSLSELLDVNRDLPEFRPGDIIPFEKGKIEELHAAALVLVDSFESPAKPILKADEAGLQKRIQHDKITGLKLTQLEIVDMGEFDLSVNSTMRSMIGYETRVTGTMRYPGFGQVQLDFPFLVLESDKFFRFGPYDANKRILGPLKNAEIARALDASKNVGAFAVGGTFKSRSKGATGLGEGPH